MTAAPLGLRTPTVRSMQALVPVLTRLRESRGCAEPPFEGLLTSVALPLTTRAMPRFRLRNRCTPCRGMVRFRRRLGSAGLMLSPTPRGLFPLSPP